ncbi:hypothetical protein ATCC90586_004047 [Pythium insidiosum]|nr:hypothetical protein ATCC90586_004047 [Pythium insidiosum]
MSTLQLSSLVRAWWRAHEALGMSVQLKDDPQVSFSDRQRRVSCGARKVELSVSSSSSNGDSSTAHAAAAAALAELLRLLAVAACAGPTVFSSVAADDISACPYTHCVWCDDADDSEVVVELRVRDAGAQQPEVLYNALFAWDPTSSSDEFKTMYEMLVSTVARESAWNQGPRLGLALVLDPSGVGASSDEAFAPGAERPLMRALTGGMFLGYTTPPLSGPSLDTFISNTQKLTTAVSSSSSLSAPFTIRAIRMREAFAFAQTEQVVALVRAVLQCSVSIELGLANANAMVIFDQLCSDDQTPVSLEHVTQLRISVAFFSNFHLRVKIVEPTCESKM